MANNELHTPVDLARDLREAVGGFDLDPCSGCEPEPIADERLTKEDDGLSREWYGRVFVNPPYERHVIDEWADEIAEQADRDAVEMIVTLVPARVNTDWWHVLADDADFVALLNNRLSFGEYEGTGHYPYAIVVHAEYVPEALVDAVETANDREYEGASITKPVEIPRIRDVGVHSTISLELDDRSIAFPENVPAEATAHVESAQWRDDGIVEVMAIASPETGPETYYLLHFDESDPSDVRCAAENVDTGGWEEAPVESITLEADSGHGDPFTYYA